MGSSNYRTQPCSGSRINYGNPLASGLVDAWIFNEGGGWQGTPRTLTNGGELASAPGGQWGVNSAGGGRKYSALATGFDRWPNTPDRAITGAVTIAVGFSSVVANPTDVQIVGKRNALGSTGMEWGIFSDAALGVYFTWNNGGSFNSVYDATLGTVPANSFITAVGTRPTAGTSGKLYKNGNLIKTTTGLSAPTSTGTPVTFGGTDNGALLFNGTVNWAFLWNRELSDQEVQLLNSDPYALLVSQGLSRLLIGQFSAANVIGANIPGQNYGY